MIESTLTLRSLVARDSASVERLIESQPAEYTRFFHVFGGGGSTIAEVLEAADRDVYSGLFWRGELICVFMLRGWDAGFEIPSFGLIVDSGHRGRQVLSLALEGAKLIARMNGSERIMVKVHPENLAGTRGALRLGFVPSGVENETGNTIYHLQL